MGRPDKPHQPVRPAATKISFGCGEVDLFVRVNVTV